MANTNDIKSLPKNALLLGYYSALLTTLFTIVTFGIAICTPPISGPFCTSTGISYPYLNILSRFPRDYIWMYPAIIMTLIYVVLMVCIHFNAAHDKKIFSQIGLSFALMAAVILILDYFIQLSVIQPSLLNGETDGIALLTQYNPHGIFIALEEIGYLLISLTFLFMAPVFSKNSRLEKSIRWIFVIGFSLTIIALILTSVLYGINREYRFEVMVITIDWAVLIATGILLSILFKRCLRYNKQYTNNNKSGL